MKLRIRDNSLRFRLTRTEVATLRSDGLIAATLNFPGGASVEYVVESSPACVQPMAHYANNSIGLRLPESVVKEWADSDQVSISSEEALDGEDILILLIEKDFACLAVREGEDESDMFPNPNEGQENG